MTAGPGSPERSPLDRAVDLLVYAPLGLAVAARDELPQLIARGRKEAEGQVGMARVVGRFAVDRGQKEAVKLLRQAARRLAGLGLVPDPGRGGPPGSPPGASPAEPAPPAGSGPAPEAAGDRASAPARGASRPDAASLAIPGYDSLSAPHVVQRLDGLSGDELEAVRAYEAAHRARKTILGRIAQLQSGG
ncbi:MAG: hypothetical protein ACLGIO_13695 [Acidimicrobiia bacterium]